MEAVPTDVWVHPGLAVRTSPIAGRGLFATAPIAAGTVVIRLGGRVVSLAELRRLFEAAAADGAYVDTFALDRDRHLVLAAGTIAHYGNHSCEPTMAPGAPFELATLRDVEPDDELTIDYALISDDPTFRMDCTCGTSTCRRTITSPRAGERRYAGVRPLTSPSPSAR